MGALLTSFAQGIKYLRTGPAPGLYFCKTLLLESKEEYVGEYQNASTTNRDGDNNITETGKVNDLNVEFKSFLEDANSYIGYCNAGQGYNLRLSWLRIMIT